MEAPLEDKGARFGIKPRFKHKSIKPLMSIRNFRAYKHMQTLPVVDVGAPDHTAALDEVVRVQSSRILDPGLQHPKINM